MKTLIAILIIVAFLQTTILPIDLVLIILICRSYIKVGKLNLILGFWLGLLVSFLDLTPLGVQAVIYLFIIQLVQVLSKFPLAGNSLLIVPISLILLSLNHFFISLAAQTTTQLFPKVIVESLLSLPVLYLLRLWEDRFFVRKEIRLKIAKH
ncbi:hypothetical protein HY384_02850 [Candidatus Daviesbacteria bacterium]|nr:hypothetical protein [Candidatus Daviesbacteria bacterium]